MDDRGFESLSEQDVYFSSPTMSRPAVWSTQPPIRWVPGFFPPYLHIVPTFTFTLPCIVTNFFVIKPTRCTSFTNLFCHETLHVSVHHQDFIHCTLSNGICHNRFVDSFRAGPGWNILVLLESCLQTYMTYTIAECTVNKLLVMDRRTVRFVRI